MHSTTYWQDRYRRGGQGRGKGSGSGSVGEAAAFKADVVNGFIRDHDVHSLFDYGCGDGEVAKRIMVDEYVAYDPSVEAVTRCMEARNRVGRFISICVPPMGWQFDLVISLDVIFHLLEDDVYQDYMRNLFAMSSKYVIVHSTNYEKWKQPITRHREFIRDMPAGWMVHLPPVDNPHSFAKFYFLEKVA